MTTNILETLSDFLTQFGYKCTRIGDNMIEGRTGIPYNARKIELILSGDSLMISICIDNSWSDSIMKIFTLCDPKSFDELLIYIEHNSLQCS